MKQKKIFIILLLLLIAGIVYIGVIQESNEKFLLEFKNSSYELSEPIDTIRVP